MFTLDFPPSPQSKASPELAALYKRIMRAENKFRDDLKARIPQNVCFVTDIGIFDDPKNFPQLKGTASIDIKAAPSHDNPNTFAFAITITAVQGPYVENNFLILTYPVLVDSEKDYATGADNVIKMWTDISEGLAHPKNARN